MLSEFHLVLHELEHDDCPLTPNLLSRMSGPTPSEADGFVLFLERISPERKRDIITRMVEYSEENFEIDYMDIFRRCLNDSDPSVRRQAIEGLWEDDRPGLVKPLLSILSSDKDSAVCASAAASLGRFLFLAECDELDSALGDMIEQALHAVIESSDDIQVARRAIESLAYINDDSVRRIIEQAYAHHDAQMRESAVFAMGRSADRFWTETVLAELYADSPAMRYEAARACGELQLQRAVEPLARLISDSDSEIRGMTVWALGQIGGKHAQSILERCIEGEDEFLSAAAAEALAEMEFADRSMDLMVYGPDDLEATVDLGSIENADERQEGLDTYRDNDEAWRDDFIELN